jgi:hypothetical protein
VSQFAVVGQQQQALARIIQPPHRIYAALDAVNQIHHSRPLFRIAHRRDVSLGLVEQKIRMALRPEQQLPVDADMVKLGISLAAQFGDHLPIDLHMAGNDQFLGLAARRDPGRGNDFLQALSRHELRYREEKSACFFGLRHVLDRGF